MEPRSFWDIIRSSQYNQYTYEVEDSYKKFSNPVPLIPNEHILRLMEIDKIHMLMSSLVSSLHGDSVSDRMKMAMTAIVTDDESAWAALSDYLQENLPSA